MLPVQLILSLGIPVLVIIFTVYGFWRKKHKYLYPFLIISVSYFKLSALTLGIKAVQLCVCLIMGVVIGVFSIFNYDTLKVIIAYHLNTEPSASIVVAVVGGTVLGCCLLAIIHVWQVLVIHR